MFRKILGSFFALAILSAANPAGAVPILLDLSPSAIGTLNPLNASNFASSQNFVTRFSVDTVTELTGIDSYADSAFGFLGQTVTIRIYDDNAGTAPNNLLFGIASTISIIDLDGSTSPLFPRRFAPIAGVTIDPGSYWIGVSGTGSELAQLLVDDLIHSTSTAQMNGTTLSFVFGDFGGFDQASIRVYGMDAIPEPSTLALFATGLALLAFLGWRRRGSKWLRAA